MSSSCKLASGFTKRENTLVRLSWRERSPSYPLYFSWIKVGEEAAQGAERKRKETWSAFPYNFPNTWIRSFFSFSRKEGLNDLLILIRFMTFVDGLVVVYSHYKGSRRDVATRKNYQSKKKKKEISIYIRERKEEQWNGVATFPIRLDKWIPFVCSIPRKGKWRDIPLGDNGIEEVCACFRGRFCNTRQSDGRPCQ